MEEISNTIRTGKMTIGDAPRHDFTRVFHISAIVLLGGGFSAPLLGIVFFIIHSLFINDRFFSQTGSVLVFISIPMLFAGSHFLDKLEATKRASRMAEIGEERK